MKLTISASSQLSTHFKSLRRAKGWSQAELGQKLGLGQARVAQIEGDPGSISVDKLLQILHFLDAKLVIEAQVESKRIPPMSGTSMKNSEQAKPAVAVLMKMSKQAKPAVAALMKMSKQAKPAFGTLMKKSERAKPVFMTLMKKSERAKPAVAALVKKSKQAERVVNVLAHKEREKRVVETVPGPQRRMNLQRNKQPLETEKPVSIATKTSISISSDSGLLTPKPPLAKKNRLPPSKSSNKSSKLSITKKK